MFVFFNDLTEEQQLRLCAKVTDICGHIQMACVWEKLAEKNPYCIVSDTVVKFYSPLHLYKIAHAIL